MALKKVKKSFRSEKTKKVSNEQMSQMRERLKEKIQEYEKEYLKQNPNKNLRRHWLKQIIIARKTGYSPGYISGVLHGAKEITVDVLVAFKNAFDISSDYVLYGKQSEETVSQIATAISIPKDLIDQVITNKGLQEQQGPLTLPILNLSKGAGAGNLKSGLLIIQDRIYGRRKNFIPIRIDGDDQINIILLEKNLGGQIQK
jgi:transcriptional regulator with XRE-family HTH domain